MLVAMNGFGKAQETYDLRNFGWGYNIQRVTLCPSPISPRLVLCYQADERSKGPETGYRARLEFSLVGVGGRSPLLSSSGSGY